MKPPAVIGPPDSHYLSAASGWLGLGDAVEAAVELDHISPALQSHPDVMQLRYDILAKGGQWDQAGVLAETLVQNFPHNWQYWIWHAYAKRRAADGGLPQAHSILNKARELFPKVPLIRYNLGCYECQMGNLDAAWHWLEGTFAMGDIAAVKTMALKDRDLEPLWSKIRDYKPGLLG